MIYKESKLHVIDNSGAKDVLCIRVLKGNPSHGVGYTGCRCVVTIKRAVPKNLKRNEKLLKKEKFIKFC